MVVSAHQFVGALSVEDDFDFCNRTANDWKILLRWFPRMNSDEVVHVAYGFSGFLFRPTGFRRWTRALEEWNPNHGGAIDNQMIKVWDEHLHVYRWSLLAHAGDETSTIETVHASRSRTAILPLCLF